jgi:iron complex outermembrane receptor protein
VRGTLLFRPSSDITARLKINYVRDRVNAGQLNQLVSCPDGTVNFLGIPFIAPNDNCKLDRTLYLVAYNPAYFPFVRNNGEEFTWTTQRFGTLEWNYNITKELTLTSLTGYYNSDVDGLFNGTTAGFAGPAIMPDKNFSRKEFTQEVRLNSNLDKPINFTLGAFYQKGRVLDILHTAGSLAYGLPINLNRRTHDMDINSLSLFGQLRFKPTKKLEIAAGARWTDEKRSDDIQTYVGNTIVFPNVPDLHTKNWSPELTATYTPTDDLTLFGSLKQGYKSGSYAFTLVLPGGNNSFGDERVRGGEIGLKTRLADRQIYANIAGYYYIYSDLQVGAGITPTGGVPVFITLNAGKAKVYGVDFDWSYRPRSTPGLELRAAVNWNHARFTEFNNAPCFGGQTIAEGCNALPRVITNPAEIAAGHFVIDPVTGARVRFTASDLKGSPLVRAPNWQAVVGANYETPLGQNLTFSVGGDVQYSSSFPTILGKRRDFFQNAYAKLNLHVSMKGKSDGWELALIGNNLTNKLTMGTCSFSNTSGGAVLAPAITGGPKKGPSGSDEVVCSSERGRELWIRLTLRPSRLLAN